MFITSNALQVARIVAVRAVERRPRFGSVHGRIRVSEDFDEPLPDFAEVPVTRALLDTHTFMWLAAGSSRLGKNARATIEDTSTRCAIRC